MGVVKKYSILLVLSCIISILYFAFAAKGFYKTQVIPYGIAYYPFGILTLSLILLPLTKCVPYFQNNHKFSTGQIFLISMSSLICCTFFMKDVVGGAFAKNYDGGFSQFYRVGYTNLLQLPLYMEDCKHTDWILHEDEQGYFYYDKRGNRKEATGIVSFEVEYSEPDAVIAGQIEESKVYDTTKGFTVNYSHRFCDVLTTSNSIPKYRIPWVEADQSNPEFQSINRELEEPIGIRVGTEIYGDIIRFISYHGTEPVPSEQFYYPSQVEELREYGKGLEYFEKTMVINNKTFTVGSTRYPRGVFTGVDMASNDEVVTQYHYTENGKSYVLYNINQSSDPEDIVIETMEFMCFTLEVTD